MNQSLIANVTICSQAARRWCSLVAISDDDPKRSISRARKSNIKIKELFSQDELADLIDEVVTQPPHTVQFLFGAFLAQSTTAQSSYPQRNKQFNGNVYRTPYGDAHGIVFLSGMKEARTAAAGPCACSDRSPGAVGLLNARGALSWRRA